VTERWRRWALAILAVAVLAWTVYCGFWLVTIQAPPLEGAAEQLARTRIAIAVIWLAGMVIAALALLGLWRRTFDTVSGSMRVAVAVAAHLVAGTFVAGLFLFEAVGLLIFAWLPLAAGLLLVTGWASTDGMRRRLGWAFVGWLAGVAIVALLWFFATDLMRNLFWQALALVTVAAVAWWLLGALPGRRTAQSPAG